MCVVCMEYDLGTYDTRPGVTVALRECQRKVETYLRAATPQETEVLAAVYWTAYWDGRHGRTTGEQPAVPAEPIPGKPGPGGEVEFETPFIFGTTSLLVGQITDCSTGVALGAAEVEAEFVFSEGERPFLGPGDLEMVILSAEGYASEVITEFTQLQLGSLSTQLVYVVPLQQVICLVPLADGACKVCTVKLEILSDNGSMVKVRLVHCAEGGKWEMWFKGDLPRHKDAPPKKCKTCTYWLRYEQIETVDQNKKPLTYGKYTLYHCNPDDVWQQVFVHTIEKAKALPQGKCTPGREVIVVTETTRGGKTTVRHDLYRCNGDGQWVRIGGWTEVKAAK